MRYWRLRKIWLCAIGDSAGFGYALLAIAQDFVVCYEPQRRIYNALWAVAQDFVMRYGPYIAQDSVMCYGL